MKKETDGNQAATEVSVTTVGAQRQDHSGTLATSSLLASEDAGQQREPELLRAPASLSPAVEPLTHASTTERDRDNDGLHVVGAMRKYLNLLDAEVEQQPAGDLARSVALGVTDAIRQFVGICEATITSTLIDRNPVNAYYFGQPVPHTCHGNEHMPPGPCAACVVDAAEYRASQTVSGSVVEGEASARPRRSAAPKHTLPLPPLPLSLKSDPQTP